MTSQVIRETIERYLQSYQRADTQQMYGRLSRRDGVVSFGAHADLQTTDWEAFAAPVACQAAAGREPEIRILDFWSQVLANGGAACAAALVDFRGTVSCRQLSGPGLRVTFALEQEEKGWRIVQVHWSTHQEDTLFAPNDASDGEDAFAAYQELARHVTQKLNLRNFDFAADLAPSLHEEFLELVEEGACLDVAAVRETFPPIAEVVSSGGTFSWTVELEKCRPLAPGKVFLMTMSTVVLTSSDGHKDIRLYRLSNLLEKNGEGRWIFLHQHRTLL
ncbi:nuclear transport factor 2 family protein [Streptomyces sp. NPDC051909]|uniref:nuclear transport factor 2 family protein n=1 Tax=Streptomyces sp. NPDC051909 TaxID=3154944 RepID=UPI0034210E7D